VDLNLILWAFIIGIGIAAVYTFYIKKFQGKLVRKLISIDACSPETAISLEKIDFKMNPAIQNELRKKNSFSEMVKATESGLYYINPDYLDKAKSKYKNELMSFLFLIVLLITLAGIGLLCSYILPEVIQKFNDIANSI
jgi:hypothetical protein